MRHQVFLQATKEQDGIGWNHLVLGRLSRKWSDYYDLGIPECKKKQGMVYAFGRRLLESLWQFTLSVWAAHNDNVHVTNRQYSVWDASELQSLIVYTCTNFQHSLSPEDCYILSIFQI